MLRYMDPALALQCGDLPGPGDLWAGPDAICDECGGWDGEHADDCDAAEPLYREPWPEEP